MKLTLCDLQLCFNNTLVRQIPYFGNSADMLSFDEGDGAVEARVASAEGAKPSKRSLRA